jgi:predicted ATPase
LGLLYDFISQAARSTQVLLTTHSPHLLDLLDPEDIRVVEKIDGVTRVRMMRDDQTGMVKEGLMTLGELLAREETQELPFQAPS